MSWRHVITWQNLIYLSQLVDVLESWFFLCFHGFKVTDFKNVIRFPFVWCRDVITSCHDVTKPDSPISAFRCARKCILFCFHGFFRSLSSKMLLDFHLCEAVTSCHNVTKPDLPISACRCARKLILSLFPCFFYYTQSSTQALFEPFMSGCPVNYNLFIINS